MKQPPPPVLPAYATQSNLIYRLAAEAWDHLWPWTRRGFEGRRFLLAASLGIAGFVSIVWLLAAAGRIAPTVVLAWWVGWSLFEVLIRLQSKPYVKDGPWWGTRFRPAGFVDMSCYVAFKNLLIAIVVLPLLRHFEVAERLGHLFRANWVAP